MRHLIREMRRHSVTNKLAKLRDVNLGVRRVIWLGCNPSKKSLLPRVKLIGLCPGRRGALWKCSQVKNQKKVHMIG